MNIINPYRELNMGAEYG